MFPSIGLSFFSHCVDLHTLFCMISTVVPSAHLVVSSRSRCCYSVPVRLIQLENFLPCFLRWTFMRSQSKGELPSCVFKINALQKFLLHFYLFSHAVFVQPLREGLAISKSADYFRRCREFTVVGGSKGLYGQLKKIWPGIWFSAFC